MTTTPPILQLRRLHPEAIMPARATPGSAGLDLYVCPWPMQADDGTLISICPLTLEPLERYVFPTGWSISIAPGYEGQVRPRSGLALRHGLTALNAPGTIDADYRGELSVLLVNLSREPVTVRPGDRIAQFVIAPVTMVEPLEVDSLPETERGTGGFGSTGR